MRKNVNIVLVAIAATTVFSASGVESSLSGADILAGRSLSDFICRNAAPETVAETFSLTNGVLTANAAHPLVLESPERYDCESFVLSAEVRYESDGFADSGLQFCIEDNFPNALAARENKLYATIWTFKNKCFLLRCAKQRIIK